MIDAAGAAAVAATAFAVGVTMGCTSIGAVLLVPVLMALAGMPVHVAAGTVLATGLATASLAGWMHARRGAVEWPLVWPLCIGGLPGGWIGASLAAAAPAQPLSATIGVLIILASLAALRPPPAVAASARSARARQAVLVAIGAASGICAGLSGAGGPIFSVPMMLVAGFAPIATVGASTVYTLAAAGSGTVANLRASNIDFAVLAALVPFLLAGIATGVRIAHRLPVPLLRRVAIGLCVLGGAAMLARAAFASG